MGSIGHLSVDGSAILSFRDSVDPTFMLLFTLNDLRRSIVKGRDRTLGLESDEEVEAVEFVASSKVVRDRLDVLGIGRAAVDEAFREIVAEQRSLHERWAVGGSWPDEFQRRRDAEDEVLSKLDLERWEAEVRKRIEGGEQPLSRVETGSLGWLLGLWDYVDPRLVLRAVADAMPSSEIVLDVTDLVEGGWLAGEVDPQQEALDHFGWVLANGTPAIVLAEGRTDVEVIRTALRILRPHLAGFIRFADFETKAEGGAGSLVRTVRAFAAAGVANRVVALFDNDTAGADAMRSLTTAPLPANIVALQYPAIELARSYPTLGPTGMAKTDVNGRACAIEMYLGDDVLRDEGGEFRPVQWTGFVRSLNRYQGELVGRSELVERFREKAHAALRDGEAQAAQDWSGLEAVIQLVVATLSTPRGG